MGWHHITSSNDVTIIADVHDYKTRNSESLNFTYRSVTKNFVYVVLPIMEV